jgi:hypothetical protein
VLHFYSGQPLHNLSGVDTANARMSSRILALEERLAQTDKAVLASG